MARRKKNGDPKRAVAYIRVSTDEQKLSPEAQLDAIQAWCHREGVELLAHYTDQGVSSVAGLNERDLSLELEKRPGLLAAVDRLEAEGAGLLVVLRRDRLGREPMLIRLVEHDLMRRGARLASTDGISTENPEGELLAGMVDLFSKYERALIRARTRAALAQKRARGEKTGGRAPYGYTSDGGKPPRLVVNFKEQAVAFRIALLAERGVSRRATAAALNVGGVPARGASWHTTTVQRIQEQTVKQIENPERLLDIILRGSASQRLGFGFVYFFYPRECPEPHLVKIGYSGDASRRLVSLEGDWPNGLVPLALLHADKGVERLLHRIFAAHRAPPPRVASRCRWRATPGGPRERWTSDHVPVGIRRPDLQGADEWFYLRGELLDFIKQIPPPSQGPSFDSLVGPAGERSVDPTTGAVGPLFTEEEREGLRAAFNAGSPVLDVAEGRVVLAAIGGGK